MREWRRRYSKVLAEAMKAVPKFVGEPDGGAANFIAQRLADSLGASFGNYDC